MKRSTFVGLCASIALPAVTLAAVPSVAAPASITGTVFRDYNQDGTATADEPGWPGVTVTAIAPDGSQQSDTTAADGSYTIAGTDDTIDYRVEFTWSEPWLEAGPIGPDNQSSTQFVTGGGIANFAVSNSADYCEVADDTLEYSTVCFVNGEPQAGSDYTGSDAIVTVKGTASGAAGVAGADPAAPTHLAANTVLGSTYGLSWQPSAKRLFTSAFLKRHVGIGAGGIDAIYAVDTTAAFGSASTIWYDAIDTGTVDSNAARGMATDLADPTSLDATVFGQIYKVGWGDIDISADESTLFAVNLGDRSLYAIDIAAVDGGSTTAHTNLGRPAHPCPNGEARPFALEILDGTVWMSITCTAENGGAAADLSAAVYALDIQTGTWATTPAIDFPLNYTKGCLYGTQGCGYEPWLDVFTYTDFNVTLDAASPYEIPARPQPMVSDLEIDRDGYLTIAIRDRQGDQFGHRNLSPLNDGNLMTGAGAGDVLLASPNPDGTWTLETNGTAGTRTTNGVGTGNTGPGGPGTNQGPGGGEFFWADFVTNGVNNAHSETAIGSLALAPGRSEVAATATDPINDRLDAAGISWFDTANGNPNRSYEIYRDASTPAPPVSGKANGLGDLEALCPGAPIQIGNRIWFDANRNGVQDPDEAPIPGVTLTLSDQDPGTPDIQVTSAADGTWSFGADPFVNYTITIDSSTADVSGIPQVGSAADLRATGANSGGNDLIDSDMDPVANTILVTTGPPGANDHSLDAGFTPSGLEIGNLVWLDSNNNGIADQSEPGISGVVVELWIDTSGDAQKDTKIQDTITNATGHYNFTGLAAGTYYIKIPNQFAEGQPLSGLTSSSPTANNADDDNDNDDNGIEPTAVGDEVMTNGVVLGVGEEPQGELLRDLSTTIDVSPSGLADSDSNLSVDFGFYPLASIGNYVWQDLNNNGVQDPGEAPVPGVTVNLCDANMVTLQSTVTDAAGQYIFRNLPVGEYMVCFDLATLPAGHAVTTANAGGDDASDSDADSLGKTPSVVLGPGDSNLTLDLGIFLSETAPATTTPPPATTIPPATAPPTTSSNLPSTVPRTGNNSVYLALFGSLLVALGLSFLSLRKRVL